MISHPEPRRPAHPWARLALLVVVLAAAVVLAATVDLPPAADLRRAIAGVGPGAPLVFVTVYVVVTLAPVPKNVVSAVAGLLFGVVQGVLLVLVAALLGALLAFGLGRALGRDAVERLTTARVADLDALLARKGLLAVLVVRLMPVVPFTAVNYASGLTGIRLRDYTVGTAVGIIPGTVAYVTLGRYGTDPGGWPFLVAVAGLVLLTAGGAVAARRRRRGPLRPGFRSGPEARPEVGS